jgi:hypothetical protein
MTDWSSVGGQDVRAAISECDRIGSRDFLSRYRFGRAHDATVWSGGEEYDARALMGLAFLRATGSTVPTEEFAFGGEDGAVRRLKELGFDVVVDETLTPPPPKPRKTTAPRSTAPRSPSSPRAPKAPPAPKRVVKAGRTTAEKVAPSICPTCFMALPATGVCDNCD